MHRPLLLALVLALCAALLLIGCYSAPTSSPSTPDAPDARAAQEPIADRVMPFRQRQAQMPKGMPIEIPVIAGSVVSTSAPVQDWSWLYAIDTTGTVETVADWYRRAYENAGWELTRSEPENGGVGLAMRKGGAESVLRVGKAGTAVRVEASIAVGGRAPSAF